MKNGLKGILNPVLRTEEKLRGDDRKPFIVA
jgi:hypothetical protein